MIHPFLLLPGFAFGKNIPSYPLKDENSSHRVLCSLRYSRGRNEPEDAIVTSNLIVLFRVLAFYIDLKDMPDFWKNVTTGWDVTDETNTRMVADFYAGRHLDWANTPGLKARKLSRRETLLVHLAGYWCEYRHKKVPQPSFHDGDPFPSMEKEWLKLRDPNRAVLFNEMEVASLRSWTPKFPLLMPHSFSAQHDDTSSQQSSIGQKRNRSRQSSIAGPREPKWLQPVGGPYPDPKGPELRGSQDPLGSSPAYTPSQPFDASQKESQQLETYQKRTGWSQQLPQRYIESHPLQANHTEARISQSLSSSYMQPRDSPTLAQSVETPKKPVPQTSARQTSPKKQGPLSVGPNNKTAVSASKALSPSSRYRSYSDSDAESEDSLSPSATDDSSDYNDTGSGAERGAMKYLRDSNNPPMITRSHSGNSSSSSSGSGESSGYSSSDSGSDNSSDESEPEPETPKFSTLKKSIKTPNKASARGKKKAQTTININQNDFDIKSEPESDCGLQSVPTPTWERRQEAPPSAQKPISTPPTKRTEKGKSESRPVKRRREGDDTEKQDSAPATKKRGTVQQQPENEKTPTSKAQRPSKVSSAKTQSSKAAATTPRSKKLAKARLDAISDSIKRQQLELEHQFKAPPPLKIEQSRSINMLAERMDGLQEQIKENDENVRNLNEYVKQRVADTARSLGTLYETLIWLKGLVSDSLLDNPKATSAVASSVKSTVKIGAKSAQTGRKK